MYIFQSNKIGIDNTAMTDKENLFVVAVLILGAVAGSGVRYINALY